VPTGREIFASDREKARRKLNPRQLYADCEAMEEELTKSPPSVEGALGYLLTSGRVFFDLPIGRMKEFRAAGQLEDQFYVVAAPTVPLRVSKCEWRYRKILQLVKKQPDVELRWLLIARWLKQEGVCELAQILPKAVLQNLIQRYRLHLRMSPTDLYHRALIRNWLTYFGRIRTELRARARLRRAPQEVEQLGYVSAAVKLVAKGRSTDIGAICQWLYGRRKGDARILRNSYSRLHAHSKESALRLARERSKMRTPRITAKK
jgi:hypothetical protein